MEKQLLNAMAIGAVESMNKSIEQQLKENIRFGLEVIEHSNADLLKNGYKITWEKSGKYRIVSDDDRANKNYLVTKEEAVDIIYIGE